MIARKFRLGFLFLLLASLGLLGPSWGQVAPDDAAPGEFLWWAEPRVGERLGLTPEQAKAIEQVVFASGQRTIDLRAALERARLELGRLLIAETITEKDAQAALARADEAECALVRERSRMRLEVARVLNREQRLKLSSLLGHRQERRMQGPLRRR